MSHPSRTTRRTLLLGAAGTAAGSLAFAGATSSTTVSKDPHMWTLRKAHERGHANHGWLDTHHTFSFANHYDPRHMGFGPLRVLNDDRVGGGAGFPAHPHRDMEIITFVLEGALEHRDTTGGGGVIRPGDVQHMTAGLGVRHSEFNANNDQPVHFLQIWILPERRGKEPTYSQTHFSPAERQGRMRLVASADGRGGSIAIGQDVSLLASLLSDGQQAVRDIAAGRKVWVHVAKGAIDLDGHLLSAGDGAHADNPSRVAITGRSPQAEVLLFDMAQI